MPPPSADPAACLARREADALAALREGPPMHRDWAEEVLHQVGLDGLVVTDSLNVYHMTGFHSPRALMGQPPESFALLARGRPEPALIAAQFVHYFCLGDVDRSYPLSYWLYTTPAGADAALGTLAGSPPMPAPPTFLADLQQGSAHPNERQRLDRSMAALTANGAHASAEWAFVDAIRAMGLDRGTIGYDDPLIPILYDRAGSSATLVRADNILRRTRLIKSPREVSLMRRSAQVNAEAAHAAVAIAAQDATYVDIRRRFFAEAALRGNTGVFMVVDNVIDEAAHGSVSDGASFSIDAVSQGHGYHGDFARTVFRGDPPTAARKAAEASAFAWDHIRERLRPGVRYSDITGLGEAALRAIGAGVRIGFKPHSIGLRHTDEPGRFDHGLFVKDDIVLRAGMTLSVDCPVIDTGIGGSAHCEDIVLITEDGCVLLNDRLERFFVV